MYFGQGRQEADNVGPFVDALRVKSGENALERLDIFAVFRVALNLLFLLMLVVLVQ
jgi:hypothetical protein